MTDASRQARDALRGPREAAARRLTERLADPDAPLAELRELQERLRLYDAALADAALQRSRRARTLVWPLSAVALLASLGAVLPVPTVPFTMTVQATSAGLDLAEAGGLAPQAVDGDLRIEGFTAAESPDPALTQGARGADRLALQGASLQLRRLAWPAGAGLQLEAGQPAVRLTLDRLRAPAVVEIEMAGPTRIDFGADRPRARRDDPNGEWLRLASARPAQAGAETAAMDLWLGRHGDAAYRWRHLKPNALRFIDRQAADDGSVVFASSLEEATITLPATGAEVRLPAGAGLTLSGLVLERCDIELGASVKLQLTGSARELRTRAGAFERSLKPSWLEFIARNHTVGLLWSTGAVLWGGMAWLRKQFGQIAP